MTRTPDEIKKGLECCARVGCCHTCPYDEECHSSHDDACPMHMDVLALIQQLEAEKQQLEGMLTHMNQLRDAAAGRALKMEERVRQLETDNSQLRNYIRLLQTERDAAVKSLRGRCFECKHNKTSVCLICSKDKELKYWQWRGVQKEDGNEKA